MPAFRQIIMKVFNTITEARLYYNSLQTRQFKLGLVPTMGALHEGHLSLVSKAKEENDLVAVSIFVNPIQFNDPKDLKKYPRDLDKDLNMLSSILGENDYVFCPDNGEMYPDSVSKVFDFGPLEMVMEGASRPGHFNGVGIVVERLFRIIMPDRAYFGEKDFQQVAVIKKMTEIEELEVEIVSCPIIRETNGLAMSSRNTLLDLNTRENAGNIYQSVNLASKLAETNNPEETSEIITGLINSKPGFKVEYLIFADENSLRTIENWDETDSIRCFAAVRAGKVRLIDNIKIELNSQRTF